MTGKFQHKNFSEININDPFFDSLKTDYPGSETSTSFVNWFQNKSLKNEQALIFEDENGIGAFIKIKPSEEEEIQLLDGSVLPKIKRVKISTIKIDNRFAHQRIGEGAIGLTLWHWKKIANQQIYLTVFEKQYELINLLIRFGFKNIGKNLNGENVFIKDKTDIDFSSPYKSFPFINSNFQNAGCIAIEDEYHDTMFAYSELAKTLQPKVDSSVANGLTKVYIGSPYTLSFKEGDPVLIYRKYTGNKGRASYKSCLTSYCMVSKIVKVKYKSKALISIDEYLEHIANKSVFSKEDLTLKYNTLKDLTLIELVYMGYFGAGNNINWSWLKNNGLWQACHPFSFKYSRKDFIKILERGKINVFNTIIN